MFSRSPGLYHSVVANCMHSRPSVPPATAQPCITCGRTTKVLEQRSLLCLSPPLSFSLSPITLLSFVLALLQSATRTVPRSFAHTRWVYLAAHSHRRGDLLDALLQTAHGQRSDTISSPSHIDINDLSCLLYLSLVQCSQRLNSLNDSPNANLTHYPKSQPMYINMYMRSTSLPSYIRTTSAPPHAPF